MTSVAISAQAHEHDFFFQQKPHNDEYRDIMIKTIQDHSHKPYKRQKKNRTAQYELKQKISRNGQAQI